jgi:hypothetical protein
VASGRRLHDQLDLASAPSLRRKSLMDSLQGAHALERHCRVSTPSKLLSRRRPLPTLHHHFRHYTTSFACHHSRNDHSHTIPTQDTGIFGSSETRIVELAVAPAKSQSPNSCVPAICSATSASVFAADTPRPIAALPVKRAPERSCLYTLARVVPAGESASAAV